MSSSPAPRSVYLTGLVALAGLAYLLWPVAKSQFEVKRDQPEPEEVREVASVDEEGLQRELLLEETEPLAEVFEAPGPGDANVEASEELAETVEGIVYLPGGQHAPEGICVIARLRSTSYPSASAQQIYALDPAANPEIVFTNEEGYFKFPELARSDQWYLTAGGDFMLSTEHSWHQFKDEVGPIPVQLCEVVGGHIEIVDQYSDSLLEKTSVYGPHTTVPDENLWAAVGTESPVRALLASSLETQDWQSAWLNCSLQPGQSVLELECGRTWPGYDNASATFKFDTIRNGVETHQLVMRDTGVLRGDIHFTLSGVSDSLNFDDRQVFRIELFTNQTLYGTAPEPGESVAVLRGIPLGTYHYLMAHRHGMGRGDGSTQVEVDGPTVEVPLDVSNRGSLSYRAAFKDGAPYPYRIGLEVFDPQRQRVVGHLFNSKSQDQIDLVPSGKYRLRTSKRRGGERPQVGVDFEIIPGQLTEIDLVLPDEYRPKK